jgi:hypothetical protein
MQEDESLSHEVPSDLLELFEVLEWQKAVEDSQKETDS